MNVFITGASGYIGSHVGRALVARGHQVTGLARKPSDRTHRAHSIDWFFADLSDHESWEDAVAGADAVIHCAMDYSSGSENVELDRAFVSRMKAYQGHFIYTGNLFSESAERLEEDVQLDTGHWRFNAEAEVLRTMGTASVVRLGFVYGGTGGYFWEILSKGALDKLDMDMLPDAVWPMIHVEDAAALYASVLDVGDTGVFHAFDGAHTTARDVIENARSLYNTMDSTPSEPHDYLEKLLKLSVRTTNRRSLKMGWRPACDTFSTCAKASFISHRTASSGTGT